MGVGNSSTVKLSNKRLTEIPKNVRKKCGEIHTLDLSMNPRIRLDNAIGCFENLLDLSLIECQLGDLPDEIGTLTKLQFLMLSFNTFTKGINPSVGRLRHLQYLYLEGCGLPCLPDSFGDLQELRILDLNYNPFTKGINPFVGRLRHLEYLHLNCCGLPCLPDSFGGLKELKYLFLGSNCLTEYPSCLLHLKNLKALDLTMLRQGQEQHGISSLPMQLVDTNLSELKLHGNPITDPPEAIWSQGLDAIKSYFREKRLGAGELCPDTINIIGDALAGKTSIAQSLVQGSPKPAAEDDRTRVMQQLRAAFGENDKQLVNINDFGGHPIYHCVISIFLPTDGLTIVAYDMSLPLKDQKDTVSRWLLTAIAKLKNIRVIVAGTRCDQISQDELKAMENEMVQAVSLLFKEVKKEVRRHIFRVEPQASNSDNKKLTHLRDLLLRLNNADIAVVSLSCREPNPGLNALRDIVSKKLRQGDNMPVRWFRVMKSISHASSNRPYLTWGEVQKLYRDHVPDEDGNKDIVVILRYLVSTSQVFWIESHEILKNFIFHSPQSIIKICKDVLSHDLSWQVVSQLVDVTDKDKERYLKGIVQQPFMMELISDKEVAPIAIQFLKSFNLISEIVANDGTKTYVVPINLPAEKPPLVRDLEQRLCWCPNSVAINLIFLGSVLPMSFFETSLSLMLTIASRLFKDGMTTEQWRHGLMILYDSVCFTAKRCNNILTLSAVSHVWTSDPWTILLPIVKGILESITASWHGASPESSLLCPTCRISRRLRRAVGENEISLEALVTKVQHKGAKWMCPRCTETIPPCLCFPLKRDSLTTDELDELKTFFKKHGMHVSGGVCRPSTTINKPFTKNSTGMPVSSGVYRSSATTDKPYLKDATGMTVSSGVYRSSATTDKPYLEDATGMSVSGGVYRSSATTDMLFLEDNTDDPCVTKAQPETSIASTTGGMHVSGGVCRPSATINKPFSEDSTEPSAEHSQLFKRLRKATPRLLYEIDRQSMLAIVDKLLAARDGAGLITEYERQDIQAERTDIDKTRKLLDIVCLRGDEAIRELVTALQSDYVRRPDLAKLILP